MQENYNAWETKSAVGSPEEEKAWKEVEKELEQIKPRETLDPRTEERAWKELEAGLEGKRRDEVREKLFKKIKENPDAIEKIQQGFVRATTEGGVRPIDLGLDLSKEYEETKILIHDLPTDETLKEEFLGEEFASRSDHQSRLDKAYQDFQRENELLRNRALAPQSPERKALKERYFSIKQKLDERFGDEQRDIREKYLTPREVIAKDYFPEDLSLRNKYFDELQNLRVEYLVERESLVDHPKSELEDLKQKFLRFEKDLKIKYLMQEGKEKEYLDPSYLSDSEAIQLGNFANEYAKKHEAVLELKNGFENNDAGLFEYLFGQFPTGRVTAIAGPANLHFVCEDQEDYKTIFLYGKPLSNPQEEATAITDLKTSLSVLKEMRIASPENGRSLEVSVTAENTGLAFELSGRDVPALNKIQEKIRVRSRETILNKMFDKSFAKKDHQRDDLRKAA